MNHLKPILQGLTFALVLIVGGVGPAAAGAGGDAAATAPQAAGDTFDACGDEKDDGKD